jgi:hypothetical protein
MAKAKDVEFVVTGDPATARATVQAALEARKFRMTWHDDWTATAERGNKIANLLVGAFAQYFKVGVRLMSNSPEQTTVRLERQSSGMMGGAVGAARTRKNMETLKSELSATFGSAGVLVGVSDA